jgi:hypothetical protein
MKALRNLLLGILVIVLVGIGGLVYRNAAEHPNQQIACPLDAKLCPDGTAVGRTGNACTFSACPPPNVALDAVHIAFAIPDGFAAASSSDPATVALYLTVGTSSEPASISIRRYAIEASSTALATIQATAIGGASGAPVPVTAYSSTSMGNRQYTVVSIERFEGVIDTAYYLARPTEGDVLRFDAIDRGVSDWTNPSLDTSTLPARAALVKLLSNLQT